MVTGLESCFVLFLLGANTLPQGVRLTMLWLTMLVLTILGKELSQSISPLRLIVWFPPSKEIRLYSPARFPGGWNNK